MPDSFIVICCKLWFLHLGLDNVDAHALISVFFCFNAYSAGKNDRDVGIVHAYTR